MGGGVRSPIPATILTCLQRIASRRTRELFDPIVGTSAGGIIALGLI